MRQIPIPIPVPLTFGAVPLFAALLAGPSARARDTTPSTPTAMSPLLRQMVDAINATDSAALAALYAETGIHEDMPAGVMVQGREEIAGFVEGALGQFRDVRFEPVSARQAGDLAVLEYAFSVTDLATGQPVTYRGVLVFELDGDLIHRTADYYDLNTILGQLAPSGDQPQATPSA